MEQEVESLVPVSNGYLYSLYEQRVDEMEENAKSHDGGYKTVDFDFKVE